MEQFDSSEEESSRVLEQQQSLESHGKQPRSWKVMEKDDDVLEFFCKNALELLFR